MNLIVNFSVGKLSTYTFITRNSAMAVGDLDAPVIPLLINNTIDPQHLNGGPLNTYASTITHKAAM